jgi:hypothetical protein
MQAQAQASPATQQGGRFNPYMSGQAQYQDPNFTENLQRNAQAAMQPQYEYALPFGDLSMLDAYSGLYSPFGSRFFF